MRRYGQPPQPGLSYPDRPGAYAAAIRGGMALLVRHRDDTLLPGGGIDPGESALQALHREVREETGWRVVARRRVGGFFRYSWLPEQGLHMRKVQHVYLVRPVREVSAPVELDHFPIWVRAEDAPGLITVSGEAAMMAAALKLI